MDSGLLYMFSGFDYSVYNACERCQGTVLVACTLFSFQNSPQT